VRWWNVKHPARYASVLGSGGSPAAGQETLSDTERHDERVMLGLRLAEGLPLRELTDVGGQAARRAARDGLLSPVEIALGRAVLTLRGRLLADAVVRALLGI
jgi:oxygen-independent coproporphyrinogen-3 oxidase